VFGCANFRFNLPAPTELIVNARPVEITVLKRSPASWVPPLVHVPLGCQRHAPPQSRVVRERSAQKTKQNRLSPKEVASLKGDPQN